MPKRLNPPASRPETADIATGHRQSLFVACLCAAWCRVCDEYRPVFATVAREFPDHCFVELDIEDHEALIDGLEVETFPSFLIAGADEVRFFGPLPPQPDALRRTVRAAAEAVCMATEPDHAVAWQRIRAAIDLGQLRRSADGSGDGSSDRSSDGSSAGSSAGSGDS